VSQKNKQHNLVHSFTKYWPNLEILSLAHS